jgi:UDP-glucose 4-epimerase
MKVCITGAGGLIGQSLIKHLSSIPDLVITGFDRIPRPESMAIQWVQGDLQNPDDCHYAVDGQDIIYHFAHSHTPLTSDKDTAQDIYANLVPMLNLLKSIEEAKQKPLLVYPSSGGAVYGVSKSYDRFTEDASCLPLSSYGIQKLIAEHYIRLAVYHGYLNAVVFRISNAYGWLLPPDRPQGFIGTAVTRVLTNQPIRLFGNIKNVRDYVHIDDIIRALEFALSYRQEYEIYNVGTGIGTSVEDVVLLIEKITGRALSRVFEDPESAHLLTDWCVIDPTKIQNQWGWKSKIGLEDGIKKMFELGNQSRNNNLS